MKFRRTAHQTDLLLSTTNAKSTARYYTSEPEEGHFEIHKQGNLSFFD